MKGKITKLDNVDPMSRWSISTAHWNIALSGYATNREEKSFPWRHPPVAQRQCPVPLDLYPVQHSPSGSRVTPAALCLVLCMWRLKMD